MLPYPRIKSFFLQKHLLFLGALILSLGDLALARPQFGIGHPTAAGNGCPEGTVRAVTSPDGNEISILFDNFQIEVAPGNWSRPQLQKICRFQIPLSVPQGYELDLTQIDYRGFAQLTGGNRAWIATSANSHSFIHENHNRSNERGHPFWGFRRPEGPRPPRPENPSEPPSDSPSNDSPLNPRPGSPANNESLNSFFTALPSGTDSFFLSLPLKMKGRHRCRQMPSLNLTTTVMVAGPSDQNGWSQVQEPILVMIDSADASGTLKEAIKLKINLTPCDL